MRWIEGAGRKEIRLEEIAAATAEASNEAARWGGGG